MTRRLRSKHARRYRPDALDTMRLEERAVPATDFTFADTIAVNSITGAREVAVDSAGNLFITGNFQGELFLGNFDLTAGGNGADTFIAKYSPKGQVLWAKSFTSDAADTGISDATAIAVDPSGNVLATGTFFGTVDFDPGAGTTTLSAAGFSQNAFAVKLDTNGNLLWAKQFAGDDASGGVGIGTDNLGSVYIDGFFTGTMDADPGAGTFSLASIGGQDGFLIKLDSSGNLLWGHEFGGAQNDYAQALSVTTAGDAIVVGEFRGTVDFGGATPLTSAGDTDVFITRFDASGAVFFSGRIGGAGTDGVEAVAVNPAGTAIYIGGQFRGTSDFNPGAGVVNLTSKGAEFDAYVVKLTGFGLYSWASSYGSTVGDSKVNGLAIDTKGGIAAVGEYRGTVDFDPGAGIVNRTSQGQADAFLLQLESAGQFLDARSQGGANFDSGRSIAFDAGGRIDTVGRIFPPADLGRISVEIPTVPSFYVAQIGPLHGAVVDFDGDAITDPGVFRPSESRWLALLTGGGVLNTQFGASGLADIPVPGDYDGDGKTDLAIFRAAESRWLILESGGGVISTQFGAPNLFDIPVPGDYDGDGKTDLAVFRPSESRWLILQSGGGAINTQFGAPNLFDIPNPGDFDGDGKTDLGVFRPSESRWLAIKSGGGALNTQFGAPNLFDIPVPGDYDGDGKTDLGVYRPSESRWLIIKSSNGSVMNSQFGAANLFDVPLPASIGSLKALGRIPGIRAAALGGAADFTPLETSPGVPADPTILDMVLTTFKPTRTRRRR